MTLEALKAEFERAPYPIGEAHERKKFAETWIGRTLGEIEALGRVADDWESYQLTVALVSIEHGQYPRAAACVRLALTPLGERNEALRGSEATLNTHALRDRLARVAGMPARGY